ncbi:hypothetical protein B0A52_07676 [Exophiala mesophila]|uniref:VIT domain-containing protein n=1 Tax=Exophiala mesophila TaxID=212818 RepID=A0A438MZR6_EXOME|nr:hypothetical protein B0A52_07676 [Exophiala mesophila]
MASSYTNPRFCGCWYPISYNSSWGPGTTRKYLPQVELSSSTTILATTSRTVLRQTFINPEKSSLKELQYTFPLYDGVSVVGFSCTVGSKTIVGVVKERQQAKADYQAAVDRGETAGLLEQLQEASDVFTTAIGNVPANENVLVEISYLGELKHDAETNGSRFTIPTIIPPRYGSTSSESAAVLSSSNASTNSGISITVDVTLEANSIVRGLQSPSHPIAVTMGRTSTMEQDAFDNNHASATLTLGTTELAKDFVLVVLSKESHTPQALLEHHPTIPNQRALMTTLVPKFNLPNTSPEIVFVVDRSGSMEGKLNLVVAAMNIFLKSLPIGVKFNICSFGSRHTFLFDKSKTYDKSSLADALEHLKTFAANYGGTEMLRPIRDTVERRFSSLPLEVMVLTDGEIWNQLELFNYVGGVNNARFFTLGIGSGASSALVEGIARAGNGFAQFVGEGEKMDNRVVRMLKGALTPHISDYSMEVIYDDKENSTSEDDFEIVDSETASARTLVPPEQDQSPKKKISLFDTSYVEEPTNPPTGRFDHLPKIAIPKTIQTPHKIPALFPFNRTTVYLLLGPDAPPRAPKLVKLRGTSDQGPLELDISVQDIGTGETLHQLAAKKVIQELEEGRSWLTEARGADGTLFKTSHDGQWDLIIEREAVRIGVDFQVAGKGTSFVAVEKNGDSSEGAKDLVLRPVPSGSSNKPQPQSGLYAMSVGRGSGARFRLARAAPPSATASMPPPPPGSAPHTAAAFSPAPAPAMCATPSPFVGGGGVAESAMARGSAPAPTDSALFSSGQSLCRALLSRTSRKDSRPRASSAKKSKPPATTGADEYFETEFAHDEPEADFGLSSEITQTDKMHTVIDLQAFDGSWSLSDELVKVLELPAGYDNMPDGVKDKTVWATMITIAWFEKVLADSEDVWEMVVDKAREWLKMKTKLSGEEMEKLNGEAGRFFRGK